MKKTRKALSLVLALVFAFSSMPMMYTSTAASGTVDNPTTAFEESNPYEYDDLYKLNLKHSNNDFFFYQTIDDEYFLIKQSLYLQQYKVSLGSNRTMTFHGINFYEGGSNVAEATDAAGVVEHPTIVDNKTATFKANYYVSDAWLSTHENSSGLNPMGDVNLQASGYDLNGKHKQYTWDHSVVFKGNSADVTGQIDTGYYERLTWNWVSDDSSASMDFRIKTTITVVDAREFLKSLAEANAVVSNPDDYPEGYVSAMHAVLNSIPESTKNLTVKLDQATIDAYTEEIKGVKTNSANYTEYNYLYKQYSSMTNTNGTYAAQSFEEFKAAIAEIDANLSKDLTMEDQAIVDQAVADLRNAYETILVNNATLTPDVTHTATLSKLDVTVGIEFNLIQVRNGQMFSLAQPWTLQRHTNSGWSETNKVTKFAVVLDTADANTNTFIERCNATNIKSIDLQTFNNVALKQTDATVFVCWDELDANGAFKDSSDFLVDRKINNDYGGFKSGNTYYLQSTPIFMGIPDDQSGETQYKYNQIFYASFVSNVVDYGAQTESGTFTTTINITDARPLVEAYQEAGIIINTEESPYTDAYIAALTTVYNAVPVDMVQGTTYYDQATVDAELAKLTELLDNPKYKADYTEYDKAKAEADSIIADANSKGEYEQTAFDSYVAGVGAVPVPDRTLSTDDQATIDASTDTLLELKATLEENRYADYTELDAAKDAAQSILDNPSAYSPETIEAVTKALEEANNVPENMVVGADNVNQKQIDDAAAALNSVVNSAIPLDGDYTEYNEAKAEIDAIISAGNTDENGNPIYDEDIFANITEYVTNVDAGLDKNLKADNQATIDEATDALVSAKEHLDANKYADYSGLEEAKNAAQEIVDNPDTYTEETVQAAQDALDAANQIPENMVVGENNVNQEIINAATDAMNQVIQSAEKKANYDEFNTAYEKIENIVNNPDDYSSETVEAAQAAKDAADALGTDQPASNQDAVNSVTDAMNDVIANQKKKANYTDYNEAKAEADAIINAGNVDENGNAIYDAEVFEQYQQAVENIDSTLPKDLTTDDQSTVDEATNNLKNLKDVLEESRIAEITVIEPGTTEEKLLEDVLAEYTIDEISVEYKNFEKTTISSENVGTGSTMKVTLKSTGEVLDYKLFIIMGDVDGDGDVDTDDYKKSRDVGLGFEKYTDEDYYFFIANDMDADGVIDAIDCAIVRLTASKLV